MLGTAPPPFETIESMDRELARSASSSGMLRFRLGAGLEALAQIGGHHELGFASVEAYALERGERSTRWVQEARWLARRLEGLPAIRGALVSGRISLSMAQVLAHRARAEDEGAWLAEARVHTVREMRLLAKHSCVKAECELSANVDEELVTLTVTVDREDAWLFECARMVAQQIAGSTQRDVIEALLGEGTTSLFSRLPRDFATFDHSSNDLAQRQWEAELSRWREGAEARCEAIFRAREGEGEGTFDSAFDFAGDAAALDSELRRIAAALSERDLALGRLAERFWKADGWRRLGYATATQYRP